MIIQTGLNDTPEKTGPALTEVVSALNAPDLIVIGPVGAPAYDQNQIRAVDAALSDASRTLGVRYISMLSLSPEFGPDHRHMTVSGHHAYAEFIESVFDG